MNFKVFIWKLIKVVLPDWLILQIRSKWFSELGKISPPPPKTGNDYSGFRHLEDRKLYINNEYCLDYLKDKMEIREEQKQTKIYHAYWCGKIGRKQCFSIKSALVTQKNCEIWLWIDKKTWQENVNNKHLTQLKERIRVKRYDVHHEIKGTPFETMDKLHFTQYKDLPLRGDVFRTIILYKYRGIYFDLDVMFLRELSDLCDNDFLYCWEHQPYANSAILYLVDAILLNKIVESVKASNSFKPWAIYNYNNVEVSNVMVYPCAYFDPLWAINNRLGYDYPFYTIPEFFTKECKIKTFRDFFPGVYAYHWHNQWDRKIKKKSYFDVFDKEMTKQLGFEANVSKVM